MTLATGLTIGLVLLAFALPIVTALYLHQGKTIKRLRNDVDYAETQMMKARNAAVRAALAKIDNDHRPKTPATRQEFGLVTLDDLRFNPETAELFRTQGGLIPRGDVDGNLDGYTTRKDAE